MSKRAVRFDCNECGLCCKKVYRALDKSRNPHWMHEAIDDFPYEMNSDGSCSMMVDNRCSVYEDRPLLCNIKKAAKKIDMPYTRKEWFRLNYEGCRQLQMEIR